MQIQQGGPDGPLPSHFYQPPRAPHSLAEAEPNCPAKKTHFSCWHLQSLLKAHHHRWELKSRYTGKQSFFFPLSSLFTTTDRVSTRRTSNMVFLIDMLWLAQTTEHHSGSDQPDWIALPLPGALAPFWQERSCAMFHEPVLSTIWAPRILFFYLPLSSQCTRPCWFYLWVVGQLGDRAMSLLQAGPYNAPWATRPSPAGFKPRPGSSVFTGQTFTVFN